MKIVIPLCLLFTACARTDFYYPGSNKTVVSPDGKVSRPHNRAIVLNGSDSLGATRIRITQNSLEFDNQGGIDNSTSTRELNRTVRHGITTAGFAAVGVAGINAASSAYGANQGAAATSNVAASKAGAATAASNNATKVALAEIAAKEAAAKALPAAGSTIPSIVPSVVTPVVP